MPAIAILFSGCAHDLQIHKQPAPDSEYNAEALAKDWRDQVKKNKINPYENLHADNDSDYRAPKRKTVNSFPMPSMDDNDSYYGRFPRYNPDDDNGYIDPKNYPLYMD